MAFADHHLSVFPDVLKGLAKLEKMHNTISVIFSNGTDPMVSASFRNSLSSYAHFFKHIVTVEETRRYKPAPEVYEMLARKVRKAEKVGKMWLVSENPVDVIGARAVGMQVVWVDRGGNG
jgi:2-haloacid dehalogenase